MCINDNIQLLEKKCIRRISKTECGFFFQGFLVFKRSEGWRLGIDVSVLNSFLTQVAFKMDTSFDLSDAYHRARE